jgi:hypothetical protein
MSKRNMSERANCGLMLCQGLHPICGGYHLMPVPTPTDDRGKQLSALKCLVPSGVDHGPLADLLGRIGESNRDGGEPIYIGNLPRESVELFRNFMHQAGAPLTGESQRRTQVLDTLQHTFGLSMEQVGGLVIESDNLDRNRGDSFSLTPNPSAANGKISPDELWMNSSGAMLKPASAMIAD